MPGDANADSPVVLDGGAQLDACFQALCELAGIRPRLHVETGREEPRELSECPCSRRRFVDAA